MVDEEKEEKPPKEEEKPEEEEGEPSPPEEEKKEEPKVPLSRLREEIKKRKEATKAQPEKDELKGIIKETLSEVEKETQESRKLEDKALKEELEEAHKIFGEFDEDKVLKTIEEYGLYDSDGLPDLDKGIILTKRLARAPSVSDVRARIPSSVKTGDEPQKEEYDVAKDRGKSLQQIAQEAIQKLGKK